MPIGKSTIVAGLALAFGLAGCGSDSPSPAPAPAAVAAGAPTPKAKPAAPPAPEEAAVKPEDNPPGDIPDDLAFVKYKNAAGRYSFTHPEGWARKVKGSAVTFTDKLNGVHVEILASTATPTVASAKKVEVPELRRTQAAFGLKSVAAVKLGAGTGVRIIYRRNSAPDAVTGRQYRDEVERYQILVGGHLLVIELFGPVGADNIDAYRMMLDSLKAS